MHECVNYTGQSRYKVANTTGRMLFYSVNHLLIDLFKTGFNHYIMDIISDPPTHM